MLNVCAQCLDIVCDRKRSLYPTSRILPNLTKNLNLNLVVIVICTLGQNENEVTWACRGFD